jgi:hypothetical protein
LIWSLVSRYGNAYLKDFLETTVQHIRKLLRTNSTKNYFALVS